MTARKMKTDVIFVGGGSAGLSGAVRARELGLKTVVVEKLGSCGGDAMIAAGFWVAAETKYQKAKGVEDSKDALYRYFMDYSSYRCRPDLIRVLVDRAAANIEWLEKQGVAMSKDLHVHGPTTVPRVHQNEGMGAQYVKIMKERADALGAEFLLKTGVKRLLTENDRVVGVLAEADDGGEVQIRGKGVVLCTGGFARNKQMVDEHVPIKKHVMIRAGWARGDGIRLAREAGAQIGDLNVCIGYKAEMPGATGLSMRSFYIILFSNYPVVNKSGARFMDESIWNAYFAHALYNQPDSVGYIIIDEAMRTGNPFHKFEKEIASGSVKKADTFATLAREAGLPADEFVATMERYNGFAQAGKDKEFGKAAAHLTVLNTPPYYAVEIWPLVLNTVGGPVIDGCARVLRPDGKPVPGLYAAGNNTAGFYDSYPSTGSGLQISSIFGQVAAEHIKELG
jgi:fumarate reductase flavoprotein subunit